MKKSYTLNDLKNAQQELLVHERDLDKCAADLKEVKVKLLSVKRKEERILREAYTSLEEMMFTISHKIRKSVATILGISKLLCEDPNLQNDELRAFLEVIINAAKSLEKSTADLSNYIHLQKENIKNIQ
jgi:signal transduction histidine kinase